LGGKIVTVADPEELGLLVETAVTVTGVVVTLPPLEVVGTPLGATKRPEVEINPVVWVPPVTPLTCQVTALLGAPFRLAVNCCVVKIATEIGFGLTVTATCCAIVIMAEPKSAGFAAETAVTVTVAGLGMELGAVYNPLVLIVPAVELPPVAPFTCQDTAVFVVPVTVSKNCLDWPGLTVADAGVTMTVICGTGVFPPPQAVRCKRIARLKIERNTERIGSLSRAGNLYASTTSLQPGTEFKIIQRFDVEKVKRDA